MNYSQATDSCLKHDIVLFENARRAESKTIPVVVILLYEDGLNKLDVFPMSDGKTGSELLTVFNY